MKNIKLLLATTAMLSTGLAMSALAGQITADFNVGATLVDHNNLLTKVQDLNFGRIYTDSDTGDQVGQTVILAPDGTISGTASQFGGEQVAIVKESNSSTLEEDLQPDTLYDISVTGDDKLYDGIGENKKLCGHVSAWTHEKFHYHDSSWSYAYKIGATFTLPSADEWYTSAAKNAGEGTACSGVATATLIYTGSN